MERQYKVGQLVIHKREGIAEIISVSLISEKEFYILKAHRGDGEMIYVPVDTCNSIIRPLLSVDEADKLVEFMKTIEIDYTSNTKQRRDHYKKLLNSGDTNDLAILSMQLRIYDTFFRDSDSSEMKLGSLDLDILIAADNIVMDELAIVYNKDRGKIKEFIYKKMK